MSSSNAPVERLHSTTEIYRLITEKIKDKKLEMDHDDILAETLITHNNAIYSATNLTPFEIFTAEQTNSIVRFHSIMNTKTHRIKKKKKTEKNADVIN